MALTEIQKERVPKSEPGVPSKSGTGSYLLPDARHAAAAIGFAAMHHSPALAAKIRAKARKLGFAGGSKQKRERREFAFYGE